MSGSSKVIALIAILMVMCMLVLITAILGVNESNKDAVDDMTTNKTLMAFSSIIIAISGMVLFAVPYLSAVYGNISIPYLALVLAMFGISLGALSLVLAKDTPNDPKRADTLRVFSGFTVAGSMIVFFLLVALSYMLSKMGPGGRDAFFSVIEAKNNGLLR